jgi:hypothetical protein
VLVPEFSEFDNGGKGNRKQNPKDKMHLIFCIDRPENLTPHSYLYSAKIMQNNILNNIVK